MALQRLREESHAQELRYFETVNRELSAFRREVSERFDRQNTRLELVEQAVHLHSHTLDTLQDLRQEVRKLALSIEDKAHARQGGALEQRLDA